jgi:hypothetical protein
MLLIFSLFFKSCLKMDRITRSSESKNHAYTNQFPTNNQSSGKLRRSAFTNASGLIGNQVKMAMPPPPPIGVPARFKSYLPEINSPQFASSSTENLPPQGQSMATDFLQEVTENTNVAFETETLPDGSIHITFPSGTNDLAIQNFFLLQGQSNALSRVSSISLSFCKNVTGATLQVLSQGIPALNSLNLTGCVQFNDNDLVHIAQMVNLKNLTLAGCSGISKPGLITLSSLLDNVEMLDLTSCPQIDNEILASLPNMYQLKHLILTACTNFSDHGLSELGKLRKLESLILDQCPQISDDSLRKMNAASGFGKLTQINLSNCPRVTPHGVFALKQILKGLRYVNSDR